MRSESFGRVIVTRMGQASGVETELAWSSPVAGRDRARPRPWPGLPQDAQKNFRGSRLLDIHLSPSAARRAPESFA